MSASLLCLLAAFILDALLGDPPSLPHPIRWMGRLIIWAEPRFRAFFGNELQAGRVFAVSLICGCGLAAALALHLAWRLSAPLGFALETVLLFYCLSARSLCQAAMEIYHLLRAGEVDAARRAVAMIVGRDVERYQGEDIARATVETVAENLVDGVLSPLFFALIGGAPLALAYKMVNTLDSMVGYKNERYLLFGRAAARIDDAANFLPARLSVFCISLAAALLPGTAAVRAWRTAWQEGPRHSSPNAGYPEAAFAGALGLRLNGPNFYNGVLVDKPYIGASYGPVQTEHIKAACRLMYVSAALPLLAAVMAGILL